MEIKRLLMVLLIMPLVLLIGREEYIAATILYLTMCLLGIGIDIENAIKNQRSLGRP